MDKIYHETRRVGEVLRLFQSNTGHAHSVGHGVNAVDGWNNEQHGHFLTAGNVNIE